MTLKCNNPAMSSSKFYFSVEKWLWSHNRGTRSHVNDNRKTKGDPLYSISTINWILRGVSVTACVWTWTRRQSQSLSSLPLLLPTICHSRLLTFRWELPSLQTPYPSVCVWVCESERGPPKLMEGRRGSLEDAGCHLLMRSEDFEAFVHLITSRMAHTCTTLCLTALHQLCPFISLHIPQSIRDNYWWNETSAKWMRGDLCHTAIKPQPVSLSPSLPFPLPPAVLWIGP